MKIKIEFAGWVGRAALEIEANSMREAVEKAVKDGISLVGADLFDTDLSYADLGGADLSGSDLRRANLSRTNLSHTNLTCATLSGADLSGANLYGANLRNAYFSKADLNGAELYGSHLSEADLRGAKYANKELWKRRPVLQLSCCGSRGRTTLVFFFEDKSEPLINCGCFQGNVKEFEAKIHETHGGTFYEYEYMAMVDYIKAIRKYQLEVEDGE